MSAKKTLEILDLFNLENRELTVAQISNMLNIPQSSVYRYIRVLRESKYLFETSRGTYLPGIKFLELGNMVMLENEISFAALPIMRQVTDKLEETSVLLVVAGLQTVCIENVSSTHHHIKVSCERGRSIPLYAGASSKAILAYMGKETVNKLYKLGIVQRHTENTIVEKEALLNNLNQIRMTGYAVSDNELDEGVFAYAVPIFSKNNIIGSLGVSGPKERMIKKDETMLINTLKEAAEEIQKQM